MTSTFDKKFMNYTQEIWQPFSKSRLTEEDSEEICMSFLQLLHALHAIGGEGDCGQ